MRKLGFTRGQVILHAVALLILICIAVYLYASWDAIPAQIVTHYDALGTPDGWSGKGVLAALAAIDGALWAFLALAGLLQMRFPYAPVSDTPEGRAFDRENGRWMLCAANLFVSACFSYIIWSSASGKSLGGWMIPVMLVLLLGSLVFLIVRARRGVQTQIK